MNKIQINILDMGWGNLEAMRFFLLRLGFPVNMIKLEDYIQKKPEKTVIVIPGIGSATEIARIDLEDLHALKDRLYNEYLVIGVCLGMHLMCSKLDEAGIDGLKIFKNDVVRLKYDGKYKSNIGYRDLNSTIDHEMYFCHAFGIKLSRDEDKNTKIIGYKEKSKSYADYAAIISKDNFLGLQFHPEKSGLKGLEFIREVVNEHINSNNRLL